MTITARVHGQSIALPPGVEVPEGAEVQVILPEEAAGEVDGSPLAWMTEFVGVLGTLPADAAERHTELAHGRKRERP